MKLPDPKRLSLDEQWSLYKILEASLPEDLSISWADFLKYILHNISDARLIYALNILYGQPYKYTNPLDIVTQFSKGLRVNDFVSFVKFIRGMVNGSE